MDSASGLFCPTKKQFSGYAAKNRRAIFGNLEFVKNTNSTDEYRTRNDSVCAHGLG